MDSEPKITLEQCRQCDAFFKEILDKAIKNQNLQISDVAEFYILSLLVAGLKKGPYENNESIAERYARARLNNELRILRDIGDLSLIISGVYWQSLLRKPVDVDYYISIGRHAYTLAGESGDSLSELFDELSEKFTGIVNVLTEATNCIETSTSDVNILRMYEVWLRTRNPFLEQRLRSLGINVIPGKITRQ